jgi:glycosyltransferase involved in cell wall biosynthesis
MIYLSIVIPVHNEERFIGATLGALFNQDYPKDRFELIVVDGGSTDSTRDIVEKIINKNHNINIYLLNNPSRLSSSARNIGIRAAKGRLLGVIDSHVYIPNNNLFINMERITEERAALCLARPAPLDVPGLSRGKSYWIALARKSWLGHSRNSYIYNNFEGFVDPASSGFAYDNCVFDRVGHFDESFDAAEDVEFHFRLKKAGIMAYTSPDLLIYSYPRESLLALFKQQVRYGKGRARFLRKHPDGLTIETLVPAGIFLFFLLSPFVFLILRHSNAIVIFSLGMMFMYWFILLLTGILEAVNRKRFFPAVFVAAAIWTIHMGLGWGFLKTIFSSQSNLRNIK